MEAESATAFPDTLALLARELFARTTALDTVFARRSFDSLRMVSHLTSMATLRMMETSSMDASAIRTTEDLIAALASARLAPTFLEQTEAQRAWTAPDVVSVTTPLARASALRAIMVSVARAKRLLSKFLSPCYFL